MPTMKNSKYWQKRFDQIEQSANSKSVKYTRELEKKYQTAAQEIDGKINAWYQRLADNNGVSMTEARKMLTDSELKEFKWTVEDYIKYGEENAFDQMWMKELENASAKFHINRLEALKLEARQQVEQLFAGGQESMYDLLADVYSDTFYRSCFEVQKGVGVCFSVSKLDDKQVSTLLHKPWSVDGTNFSEKLWGNKTKLINNLEQELSRMVLTGETPQKAIENIRKEMDSSQYAAKRLVLTEQAYFSTVAQKDAFAELDVEEYEIVATLDNRTSEICQEMDGQHFPVKDMVIGVNAPPFHVFCRSTTCPYFDDELGRRGEREAKGEDGKAYYVSADMTYLQWKEAFVADSISEQTKKDFVKYSDILGDKAPSVEEFAKTRYNKDKWKMFKAFTSSIKSGELSALADFDIYKDISMEMDEKILGIVTSNNLTITGKSNHSIARVIGSIEQRRNGVRVSDILDALTNKDSEILPVREMKNGRSQKFRNKVVEVSVNPDTGNIIQVNPVHTRRKKVES